MLIWESHLTRRKQIAALAAFARGATECFLREDKQGSFVVCERGTAPNGVVERRLRRLFSAGRTEPTAGPWIFSVGIWTPADWREEICAWYQCEHGPMLLQCPSWKGFQFLETAAPRGCQFYVLHRLASRTALDSEARQRSRATPWFHRLAQNKWFDQGFERVLCRRVNLARP